MAPESDRDGQYRSHVALKRRRQGTRQLTPILVRYLIFLLQISACANSSPDGLSAAKSEQSEPDFANNMASVSLCMADTCLESLAVKISSRTLLLAHRAQLPLDPHLPLNDCRAVIRTLYWKTYHSYAVSRISEHDSGAMLAETTEPIAQLAQTALPTGTLRTDHGPFLVTTLNQSSQLSIRWTGSPSGSSSESRPAEHGTFLWQREQPFAFLSGQGDAPATRSPRWQSLSIDRSTGSPSNHSPLTPYSVRFTDTGTELSLEINETPQPVFPPKPRMMRIAESEHLSAHMRQARTVCDVGTGSGLFALRAQSLGVQKVIATDVQRKALESLKLHTATTLELRLNTDARPEAIYAPLKAGECALIVSNPPQTPDPSGIHDTTRSGGAGGTAFLDALIRGAARPLTSDGTLCLIHYGYAAPKERVQAMRAQFETVTSELASHIDLADAKGRFWQITGDPDRWETLRRNKGIEMTYLDAGVGRSVRFPIYLSCGTRPREAFRRNAQ